MGVVARRIALLPLAALAFACSTASTPSPSAPPSHAKHEAAATPALEKHHDWPVDPGPSCEVAKRDYAAWCQKHRSVCDAKGPHDVAPRTYGAILNHGDYMRPCDVPRTTEVTICVALLHGKVEGLTVTTSPSEAELEDCIASKVRELSYPDNPRLDVARTHFAAE